MRSVCHMRKIKFRVFHGMYLNFRVFGVFRGQYPILRTYSEGKMNFRVFRGVYLNFRVFGVFRGQYPNLVHVVRENLFPCVPWYVSKFPSIRCIPWSISESRACRKGK